MPDRDRYDVVVVGAGPFGLASAYHLIERDPRRSILVVEARSGPGEGSMGASSSMVRDVFSSWDNHLLAKNSIAFYRRLMEEDDRLREPVPLLDLFGYLWLLPEGRRAEYLAFAARSEGTIDARPVDVDALRTCPGLELAPARWYEGDGAPPPEPITGALFGRNCGAIAPEVLARYYCDAAKHRGVEFAFDTCVQRLSFEGRDEILLHGDSKRPFAFQDHMAGRLRISRVDFGDGRSVRADRVVVAAGAWSSRILDPLGMPTACSPRLQLLNAVSGPAVEELLRWEPPVDPIDAPGGRSRCPFVILPSGATLKPIFRQRHLWIGGVDTVAHPIGTREDPGRDGRLDYNMAQLGDRDAFATDLLPAVTPYLPRFETSAARLENSWGGYYNFSPDGLPIVSEEPYGVVFVGGDSGSGIMKADSLGRIVAAVCDGAPEAALYTGEHYQNSRLALTQREVRDERIIL